MRPALGLDTLLDFPELSLGRRMNPEVFEFGFLGSGFHSCYPWSRLYAYRDKYSVNVDAMQGVIGAIMPRDFNLGRWIRDKYRSQAKFAEKLGVDPTRLSRWMNLSDGISDEYQAKIRKLGYTGPWPNEEAQESPALAGGPYVTEKAFEDVPGRLKRLEEDSRAVLPLVQAVRDLDARVRELEKRLERSE